LRTLLALIVLLLLALAASARTRGGGSSLAQRFFLAGAEFLVLGWALGALGILGEAIREALHPLVILGLSWIGLLLGLQFELRQMGKIPASYHAVGLAQGLLVLGSVSLTLYPLLARLFGSGIETQAIALLLGSAAATSSQGVLALVLRERNRPAELPDQILQLAAGLDSAIPVLILALFYGTGRGGALSRTGAVDWPGALAWLGYATALGFGLGLLLILLLHRDRNRAEHLLLTIGFLIFTGGLAMALGFPPLYLSFVAGATLVNFSGRSTRTWEIAVASERPFYYILLLLVGAAWRMGSPWALLLAPLFFLLRIAAKSGALWLAARALLGPAVLGRRAGPALSGQGAVALALTANLQLIERGTLTDSALTMILAAVILSSLLAPGLTALGLDREAGA